MKSKRVFSLVLALSLCLSLLPMASMKTEAATKLYWPLDTKWGITTGYTAYVNHDGVDMAANQGTPVYANFSGTATFYQCYTTISGTNYLTSYGNCVYLSSSDGVYWAVFAHLNAFEGFNLQIPSSQTMQRSGNTGKITIGSKWVNEGDVIGYVGTTGNSTGNHLHYGLKINGSYVNPTNYLDQSMTAKTAANSGTSSGTACKCSSSYAGSYICTTSSAPLTIRRGHGTSYEAIGSIPSGATVTVSKASGTGSSNWAHVTYNGISGYASMEYLKKGTTNATITVFSQTDSRWGSHQYGYSNSAGTTPATISSGGCGILAFVNAVYYMNGNFINPITLADWSVNNGYRVNGVGTAHGLYPAYSNAYGSTYGFSCTSSAGTSSWDTLTSHLQNGGAAIVPTTTYATGSAHLLAITDYNAANGTYLVLDSYASSYRGTSSGYAWMTKATFQSRMSYSKFILISNTSGSSGHTTHTYTGSYYEAAHPHRVYQMCSCGATQYTGGTTTVSTCESCNPVTASNKYNSVLPFKAYLKGTSKVYPYTTAQLVTQSGGEIWSTDECTITAVYSNGACKVTYPVGSSTKTAYTSLSNFIGNTSASLTKQTVNHQVTTYIRSSTSSMVYGYIGAGDTIYKMGTSGSMTQIFYPVSSGYKVAWVLTSELIEPTYDTRFNPYCPIKGYPCVTSDFDVFASDYVTVTGEIWATDYCTINAVYADGWCQVSYPAGSTTKTAYAKLSNFVYNVSASHTKYTAKAQTTTYTNQSLSTDNGWLSAGDVFYVVGAYGSASQVLYPIDAQYGGGYKLGWIKTSDLPKTTYTISYNANGGSGAPSSQTKTHGTALTLSTTVPTRTGYAFVGWATSSSATSATYAPGASYTTDANLALYAVWTLNKYEITYNANGGTNAPAAQNKAHGTNLTLSTSVPTKAYVITFDPNGGTVDVAKRQGSCEFMGWATSSTATTAAYQPGGTFTTNANTTLYAVWKNPTLALYSIPARTGYVFDGWYTAAEGGTQITTTTTISSDMTVYAHWVVETYGVHYDANGGHNAPAEQIKTHGKDLKLSTTVPSRENYTFLGWASEENPGEVQYQPGDTYSADMGIMLIAVWKCDLNPAFTVGEVSGKPGDTVTVPIRISENPGIIAARLKIAYDSDTLTLTEVKDGGILGENVFGGDMTANPYIVTWENGLATSDYTATGTLVYLTFKIAEDAPAGELPITVSYDPEEIYNKDEINVAFAITQGSVMVEEVEEVDPNAPQIVIESQAVTGGQAITVEITAANMPSVKSLMIENFQYDSNMLEFVSAELNLENAFIADWDSTDMIATVAFTENTDINGVIMTMTFNVKEDIEGECLIRCDVYANQLQASGVETQVELSVVPGTITVMSYERGDVNGDGYVNSNDAIYLLRYTLSPSRYPINQSGDMNGDGYVNSNDAIYLLRHTLSPARYPLY